MDDNIPPDKPPLTNGLEPVTDTYIELLSVLESKLEEENFEASQQDLLYIACCRIGKAMSIPIKPLPAGYFSSPVSADKYLEELSYINAFRFRNETLQPFWWQNDCGTLLAFNKQTKEPLVLIRKKNQYFYYDTATLQETPLTPHLSALLETKVYIFYKTLPEKPLAWKDLFLFVFKSIFPDFKMLITLQICIGILALLIPIFTKIFFESIIPNADVIHLKQLSLILAIAISATTFFLLSQTIYSLRMRFKSNITLESAVWDRLLKSPVNFINQYSAGDLTQRAAGVDHIQQHISTSIISTALGSIFSFLSLLLMFYFDIWLAFYTFFFAVCISLISFGFTLLLLQFQRPFIALQGKLAGLLFELLTGVSKIRVAHKETQIFKLWAHKFTQKNSLFFKIGLIELCFHVLFPLLSIIGTILLFIFVIQRGANLSFGNFMGFSAAFVQFMASFLGLSAVLISILEVIPLYERVKPILLSKPEKEENQSFMFEYKGALTVENLNFRYHQDLPLIIDNMNFSIQPGEFVAIMGATGSGKSTLLRLLMGFENPQRGQIFYDGHDINTLNLRAVRQHFGVVLQNSTLLPGTIFENLTVLNSDLTQDQAWQACELMQIADEIREMPMRLHTMIAEFGKNISVGQRQRIMLARAIVHQPKILFLDEATSALDNTTQNKIHENLSQLKITRVVIAHRISAIKNADKILFIENGQIVESGNFEDLLQQQGLFAKLWEIQKNT